MQALSAVSTYFSDVVLQAMRAIEVGSRESATFTYVYSATGLRREFRVWAEWVGDVYSWRVLDLDPAETDGGGTELYAGEGEGEDAEVVAARLAWNMALIGASGGNWIAVQ